MKIIYNSDIAMGFSGKEEEEIDVTGVSSLDGALMMIYELHPALKKEIDDGDILVLHNGEATIDAVGREVKDSDTIEFAPVILGG